MIVKKHNLVMQTSNLYLIVLLREPSISEALHNHVDKSFINDWEKYNLNDDILYKASKIGEDSVNWLCLPTLLRYDIFLAEQN